MQRDVFGESKVLLANAKQNVTHLPLVASACFHREVSNAVAEAMHHWRAESGDPFLCVDCATHIAWGDAISAMDIGKVGNLCFQKQNRR